MAWDGYFSFGGTEIVNVERAENYALNGDLFGFRPIYNNNTLHQVLGDTEYNTPFQDLDTPWADPNDPDSGYFYGLYPMEITGIEASTRTSNIQENTGDGGTAGRLRHGTRSITFNMLLLAATDAGADYGMNWLRSALLAGQDGDCSTDGFNGAALCYFAAEPVVNLDANAVDVEACSSPLLRYLYSSVVTSGPTINAKKTTSTGWSFWDVTFTMTCGIPWEFGEERKVLSGWLSGVAGQTPGGGSTDNTGYVWVNKECATKDYVPVFDPLCPDLVLPPVLPKTKLGCFNPPANWLRRTFTIPSDLSRMWTEAVPYFEIITRPDRPVRNLRLRIYSDPEGTLDPDVHYCSYCADYLITYIPDNGVLTIDGRNQNITFTSGGQTRRADSLVMSSMGTPLLWPGLVCGVDYVATLDSLQTQRAPSINFSLIPKSS